MSEVPNFEWVKEMKSRLATGVPEGVDPLSVKMEEKIAQAIEMAHIEREKYVAEVGKRDGVYVYHFYLRSVDLLGTFGDKLGDAFIKVFKFQERLSSKHDEIVRCHNGQADADEARAAGKPVPIICGFWGQPDEFSSGSCPNCGSTDFYTSMSSWAVRVTGYADNPLADDLAPKVFDVLDSLL